MGTKILFIGYNFSPEPTGIGKYSGEMIHWLASRGFECTVITTYPYYPYWKVQEPYYQRRRWFNTEKENFPSGGKITVHRCPMYVPTRPTAIRRMILDISFLISAFFKVSTLIFNTRFDLVITVAPSFHFGLLGILVKKIHKSKLSYHVQDLQIEAARELNLIRSNSLINLLFKVEKYILHQSDFVSTISPAMIAKMKIKSDKKIHLFANWVNIEYFRPLPHKGLVKKALGYSADDRIVLYSGSVGEKQGLERILNSAKELKYIKNLHFLICGSGPFVENLLLLKKEMGLVNLKFLPLQPLVKFNKILNCADIHLVLQKSSASDLMLPSKLTNIWAVGGVPLVTAYPGSYLYNMIQTYNTGLIVESDDQEALNAGIIYGISRNWDTISLNSRSYAEKYLSIDSIMNRFESQVLKFKSEPVKIGKYVAQRNFLGGLDTVFRD